MEQDKSASCVCVQWKTQKPNIGEWRRTPYFHLRQGELCLELALKCNKQACCEIVTSVVWRRRLSGVKTLYTQCYVKTGSKMYYDEVEFFEIHYQACHVNSILRKSVEIPVSPSMDNMEEWSVICQFSCGIRFEYQAEKKTIHLTTVDDTIIPRSVNKGVQVSSEIPQDIEALSHDYARLLKEEILPDFKLRCGGQTFPVHKCVLATRSEVFQAMLRSEMQESKTGSVVIKDLEVSILKLLLNFIYSGKLEDISIGTACNLYEAADKYAVRSLITACSYYMIRNVTVENCLIYLKTADSHSDPDLKAAVSLFVIQHPAVFKSTAWVRFSGQHPVLANEVLQTYVASLNQ